MCQPVEGASAILRPEGSATFVFLLRFGSPPHPTPPSQGTVCCQAAETQGHLFCSHSLEHLGLMPNPRVREFPRASPWVTFKCHISSA